MSDRKIPREPIAVIGIGCRFPGGITDAETLWERMRAGSAVCGEVPEDRGWNRAAWYDPDPAARGKSYTLRGSFLDDVAGFDPGFFGVSRSEANSMDPQQRLFLEVVWDTLADAGVAPASLAGTRVGVFAGALSNEYLHRRYQEDPALIDAHTVTGNIFSIIPGRVSYLLKLRGPSMAVESACSSSLLAAHLACQSLAAGECDYAIAGGVNLLLAPEGFVLLSRTRSLAPDGCSKTFDAAGDGYGRGEGCGAVLLQRLGDAQAANARILAVIAGSAVNQDGGGGGLTAPNPDAQRDVIRTALANAGIQPSAVGYLEAHGTGTVLGDPIEIRAAGDVLGEERSPEHPLFIGSVKANLGHAEAAAGIAGLIRAALALHREEIPPQARLRNINPHLDLARIPARIPQAVVPWKRGSRPRYCGVSAFGFTGTNVHVVLGEGPRPGGPPASSDLGCTVVPLSAHTESALHATIGRYRAHLARHPEHPLQAIAFTAAVGRDHLACRRAFVAAGREDLEHALQAALEDEPPAAGCRAEPFHLAFLFTGQGGQWSGAGRALYEFEPVFRAAIDRCDAVLRARRGQSLTRVLFDADAASLLNRTEWTQPALFALECGLADLWNHWGVHPEAVLGHSAGQYAAAYAAGCISLEDGAALMEARGRLMQGSAPGAMLVLHAAEASAAALISPFAASVAIAAVNSPDETVVSGTPETIAAVAVAAKVAGIRARRLEVSQAFHSPSIEPVLGAFEREAAFCASKPPWCGFVSDSTGEFFAPDHAPCARQWREHARQPVRFEQALRTLGASGANVYLEIGPDAALAALGRGVLGEGGNQWLTSLRRGTDARESMTRSVAALYERGMEIDWGAYHRPRSAPRIALPGYTFERRRCWMETRHSAAPAAAPQWRLLGKQIDSPLRAIQYQTELDFGAMPFLADTAGLVHVGIYAELLLEAVRQQSREGAIEFRDFIVEEALVVRDHRPAHIQVLLEPSSPQHWLASVHSTNGGAWRRHCTAEVGPAREAPRNGVAPAAGRGPVESGASFYAWMKAARGIGLGPSVQWIENVKRGNRYASCRMRAVSGENEYTLGAHPGFLDACVQMFYAAMPPDAGDDLWLFSSARRMRIAAPLGGTCQCEAECEVWIDETGGERVRGAVLVTGRQGSCPIEMESVELRRTGRNAVERLTARTPFAAPAAMRGQFAAASEEDRLRLATVFLARQVRAALGASQIDPDAPLTQLGIDSIVAMELRAALAAHLGVDLPVVAFLDGGTLASLAARAALRADADARESEAMAYSEERL